MKEFIEKLIGRLEELQKLNYEEYETTQWMNDKIMHINASNAYTNAITIVNELAEESNNDFCEWKYIDSTSYSATIPCRGNTMNIKSMRYYTYCPYCGKKIKVV